MTELLVGAEQRPHAAVAGVGPRVLEPGLVAGLTGSRHDVKRPQVLARAHVVATHVVGRHFFRRELCFAQDVGRRCRHARHDDHVAHDEGAARPAPARDGALESLREVHLTAVAEIGVPLTGLRVQCDEARAHVRDDASVGAVGPIGEAARRAAAREAVAVGARWQVVVPNGFACRRIERHDGSDDRAHIEQAVHHERRVLEVARPRRVREVRQQLLGHAGPLPGDTQVADRVPIDLVERRVFRAGFVGTVGAPLSDRHTGSDRGFFGCAGGSEGGQGRHQCEARSRRVEHACCLRFGSTESAKDTTAQRQRGRRAAEPRCAPKRVGRHRGLTLLCLRRGAFARPGKQAFAVGHRHGAGVRVRAAVARPRAENGDDVACLQRVSRPALTHQSVRTAELEGPIGLLLLAVGRPACPLLLDGIRVPSGAGQGRDRRRCARRARSRSDESSRAGSANRAA